MKRIITIQDISCVGRCSLTVALPVISACGVETAVLPTAVLSTHTAFDEFTFHDLTDEIEPISKVFEDLDIHFDAVYTGYLGSFRQLELVERFAMHHSLFGARVIVDPAMADQGKLYKGFTPEFARAMFKLCSRADVILPNLTEACFMIGMPYREDYDEKYIRFVLKQLTAKGAKVAVLTGISFNEREIGFYAYDSRTEQYFWYYNERMPVSFHGTGDIFASAFTGAWTRGMRLCDALVLAVDYTLECIRETMRDEDRRFYGVNFESALPMLINRFAK